MASVLSLPLASPIDLPFGESIYLRSQTSLMLMDDSCTVRRHQLASESYASFATAASSLTSGRLGRQKENSLVNGSTSSLLNYKLFDNFSASALPRRSWSWTVPVDESEMYDQRHSSPVVGSPEADRPFDSLSGSQSIELHIVNPDTVPSAVEIADQDKSSQAGSIANELDDISEEAMCNSASVCSLPEPSGPLESEISPENAAQGRRSPFRRWLRVIQKKAVPQVLELGAPEHRWALDDADFIESSPSAKALQSRHRKSQSSVSSLAFLTAVKTASATIASMSVYPLSRRSLQTSYIRQDSSAPMWADRRDSSDSIMMAQGYVVDDGTWSRSVQRQRIVQEMASSEESYLRDLKVFLNVNFHRHRYFLAWS